jgi:hypothetical protein
MGKPFAKELENLQETYVWAMNQQIEDLKPVLLVDGLPIFVVGSGGSLSACHYAVALIQQYGLMAKAVTPLELQYSLRSLRRSNILFISASGRNTDILFAYKSAVLQEPNKIVSLVMKSKNPLSELATRYSLSQQFNFDMPSGKDGFLATNSLVAFFALLNKGLEPNLSISDSSKIDFGSSINDAMDIFFEKVTADFTFLILYAGWGQPVAIDLESKLAEAALGNILISDYRNFGHGRHHWLDKRKKNSAIISLVTPREKELAEKTLALLPKDIPVLRITSNISNGLASIDLLSKSFKFVEMLGKIQGIDPGRPGVPEFGSKLYHLRYERLFGNEAFGNQKNIAIMRKTTAYNELKEVDFHYWSTAYDQFTNRLQSVKFGSIIFDYDGTLTSVKDRFADQLESELAAKLNQLLEKGIILGIATGRGKSVRAVLQASIAKKYWEQVIVGYYNSSTIGRLDDNNVPDINIPVDSSLKRVYEMLFSYKFPSTVSIDPRPNQITIKIESQTEWIKVRHTIIQLVLTLNLPNIQILESSHSMDIVDLLVTSKLNIIDACVNAAVKHKQSDKYLCIGDKGKWPGNDYQLLSMPYSLSVDEVSSVHDSCWNLAQPGVKNEKATLYYLSCLRFCGQGVNLKIL